ncbi:DUF2937 family protein [Oceanibaculum indicum]|uniref:DUF2937 family protein n=1 Tax=Oceanibaculum indicum TaxID=526216 RepID=A0A420WBP5_9PROT|nr:DUF2937 family protein [Oceanibaculum indicum]RKQ68408.1 Protein of unknown function (DUF2937) [Oceanibaculum indicum]
MRFLGRWLGQSLTLAAGILALALAAQAPGFAEHYMAALEQRAQEQRADIAGRIDVARRFYSLPETADARAVLLHLTEREPANAEGIRRSAQRLAALEGAHRRLVEASPLLRPLLTLPAVAGGNAVIADVADSALAGYTPRLPLSLPALAYGLAGLFLGVLLAEALVSLARMPFRRATPAPRPW